MIVSPVPPVCSSSSPDNNPFTPRPDTPSDHSESVVTKRSPSMLPSEEKRLSKSSSVASKLRNTSSSHKTSARPETSVSASTSTLTWELSTTQQQEFMVWTSSSALPGPAHVSPEGRFARLALGTLTGSRKKMPSSGSKINSRVLCSLRQHRLF